MNIESGNKIKVAVAMSGGVDSSVAAVIMTNKYGKNNVIGLTMKLFCYQDTENKKSCCSLDSIEDAKTVCNKLGIAHYVINAEKEFKKEVINNFITEYDEGRTPNPCVRCNKYIKFDLLIKKAREYGINYVATGHYAQIENNGQEYKLLKGIDSGKDQSYFLYDLPQEKLQSILFPLGKMTKLNVRKIAKKYDLVTAYKKESQDICFISNTVEEFLKSRIKQKSGSIVDLKGKKLGKHEGLALYTIGQRKGLGGGFKEPMFVIRSDRKTNELVIGPEINLFTNELVAEKIVWVSKKIPTFPFNCKTRIRYQSEETGCQIEEYNNKIKVYLATPQRAISPGQSVVFYLNDVVLGGGIIAG